MFELIDKTLTRYIVTNKTRHIFRFFLQQFEYLYLLSGEVMRALVGFVGDIENIDKYQYCYDFLLLSTSKCWSIKVV